jgi:hypothetical protein
MPEVETTLQLSHKDQNKKRWNKNTGYYCLHRYNARLAAAKAALVHRFLTLRDIQSLPRAYANRACQKNPPVIPGFRLAAMFCAPVSSARSNV